MCKRDQVEDEFIIEINLMGIKTKYDLFRLMSKQLNFPCAYVGTWDSFLDYMSFLYVDIGHKKSVVLKFINAKSFSHEEDFNIFVECMRTIECTGFSDDHSDSIGCSVKIEE